MDDAGDVGDPSVQAVGPAADRDAASPLAPEEAFGALANPVRTGAIRALHATDGPLTFSELHDATGTDTTAGFAYHLRQLTGHFVRETGEGYELTPAGERAARVIETGGFTAPRGADGATDDPCPFCGATALDATVETDRLRVACGACGRRVVGLPLPGDDVPGGRRAG